MPTPMQVPPRAVDVLRRLADVDDQVVARLADSADEQVRTPDGVTNYLTTVLGDGWSQAEVRSVNRELFSMIITADHHNTDTATAAKQVAASEALELDEDKRKALESALTALLSAPQIANVARAVSVLGENDRLFHSIRPITDIRPVLGVDGETTAGAVITRRLRFTYYEENDLKEVEVVVDLGDIKLIRQAIERLEGDVARAASLIEAAGADLYQFDDGDDDGE